MIAFIRRFKVVLLGLVVLVAVAGCVSAAPTSNDIQNQQQEKILQEGTAETGMPAIKNFRERKLLKDIIELRDQDNVVTYTYLENVVPKIVPGYTAVGGKLTYLFSSVGYGIPYATQYTNPEAYQRVSTPTSATAYVTLPQAEPTGNFSPPSADGTWIMGNDPTKSGKDGPSYIESHIDVFPFEFPLDQ